tara:strand:- start:63 stop:401 length:339 start_codon:yes stop_codon:yes gene_type:complete
MRNPEKSEFYRLTSTQKGEQGANIWFNVNLEGARQVAMICNTSAGVSFFTHESYSEVFDNAGNVRTTANIFPVPSSAGMQSPLVTITSDPHLNFFMVGAKGLEEDIYVWVIR